MKTLNKLLRIYLIPTIIFAFCVALSILSLRIFLKLSGKASETSKLAVEASVTFLAAFAGIFIPILINRNLDKESDRRTRAFTLGLIWHENLYNKYLLEEINGHLKELDEILTWTGARFAQGLHPFKSKVEGINHLAETLHNNSFVASQSSGAIKTLDDDKLFNEIIELYQTLQDVQVKIGMLRGNAIKNSELIQIFRTQIFQANVEAKIKTMLKKDIEGTKAKVATALKVINTTIKNLGIALDKLGVKTETSP